MKIAAFKTAFFVAAMGLAAGAMAGPVLQLSEESWAAATSDVTTIDFNAGSNQLYRGTSYRESGVTFSANSSVHSIFNINYDARYHASGYLDLEGSRLGMDFGSGITALSLQFGGFYDNSVLLHIVLDSGDSYSVTSPYGAYGFFGITTDTAFDSISITTTNSYTAFDNVSFGRASSAPVPEPGTLALLCLGLAGVGFGRRK